MNSDTANNVAIPPVFRYKPGSPKSWELDTECVNPPNPDGFNIFNVERTSLTEGTPAIVLASAAEVAEKVSGMELNLGQHTAEWILGHQHDIAIPTLWHKGFTLFPATRWRKLTGKLEGTLYVPGLYWEAKEWRLDFFTWLRFCVGKNTYVAWYNA
ncbi:MAG: hypothetical protein WD712_00530 [Candidatus Spechtbacterales bacterium]